LYPRPVRGYVRADAWDNRFWRFLLDTCEAIPLRRGHADLQAFRAGLEALERGHIVVIAPEGTRSHDGRLQSAHGGVAVLAARSGAPVVPLAYHGSEGFRANLRRLRRTDFHIRVGEPFRFGSSGEFPSRAQRAAFVAEVMGRIAALLPPESRGPYGGALGHRVDSQ
jgi:1-acyl-sn-glycerol-3-phosphate acyltransferase